MSIHHQIEKFFKQKMGLWQSLPRFQRVSDGAFIYGYIRRAPLPSNPFLSENVMLGSASGEVVINNGDLILDRSSSKRFYVVANDASYIQGLVCRYDFQAYIANDLFTIQRAVDSAQRDPFVHRPVTSNFQTIQSNVYGVLGTDRYYLDMKSYTEEETSQKFIFHNYLSIKQGDRFLSSSGREYIAKLNEFNILAGYLVKTIITVGTGG
jgi:hypothetical protein